LINQYDLKDLHLDFIGEGTSLKHLMEMVDKFHLTNYVSFLGLRDREYIYAHLKNYNMLVQPSIFEGFGLTIVEAMAAGIEVLVSDIDGPLEIIEKIGQGHMFINGSADDCALNIYKIYSNRNNIELQSKLMLQRQSCKKMFDIEITAKNYLVEYKKLINI
jgi:glycosyltransferase involved in cell wall biosynthesis